MNFRDFTDHLKGAATEQVRIIEGERDILPMVYLAARNGQVHGIPVDSLKLGAGIRVPIVRQLVTMIDVLDAELVGWTFTGRRGALEGEFDHETAVALCIDRERHETWLARLVRHDNHASLGAWRPWPANQQEGALLTPIQEALR